VTVNSCSFARDLAGTGPPRHPSTLVETKEDVMVNLFPNLMSRIIHEMGTGRAIENTRRDHDEIVRTTAIVDALAQRLLPGVASVVAEERAAA
jgi:hypothetical protein